MLDVWIDECEWFDSVMMQIGMYQRTRDEHRYRTSDDGRDTQIASNSVLAEDPHLDRGLGVIHCVGDRKVYTAIYQASS